MAILARQLFPCREILLFSGQASTANLIAQAQQAGCDFEILLKPVHPKGLLAKLGCQAG
jgi:hypothetical protein